MDLPSIDRQSIASIHRMTTDHEPSDRVESAPRPRHRGRLALLVTAAAVIVVAVVVAIVLVNRTDDPKSPSYRLGYAYGRDLVAPKLGNVDRDGRAGCQHLLAATRALAQDPTTRVNAKGVSMKPADVKSDEFMSGCLDGERSAAS